VLKSIEKENPSFSGDGYTSLCIVYGSFAAFNWLAPAIITAIGSNRSIYLGSICYMYVCARVSVDLISYRPYCLLQNVLDTVSVAVQRATVHHVRGARVRLVDYLDRTGHVLDSELGPVDHIQKFGDILGHVENQVRPPVIFLFFRGRGAPKKRARSDGWTKIARITLDVPV